MRMMESRLRRLEAAAAERRRATPPPDPELIDLEELEEDIARIMAGESREEVSRSRGRPWNPLPDDPRCPQLTDEEFRECIRVLQAPFEEDHPDLEEAPAPREWPSDEAPGAPEVEGDAREDETSGRNEL